MVANLATTVGELSYVRPRCRLPLASTRRYATNLDRNKTSSTLYITVL
jgi:hypothetical protein